MIGNTYIGKGYNVICVDVKIIPNAKFASSACTVISTGNGKCVIISSYMRRISSLENQRIDFLLFTFLQSLHL